MSIGIVGRKRGMTRVFTDQGESVPVTVIEATPGRVTKLRDPGTDGYRAVQVAWGGKRRNLINKPTAGNLAKAEVDTAEGLLEFRLGDDDALELEPGAEIKVDIFQDGQKVDVSGTTIGKGFAGPIKRHHFSSQRTTHGNSRAHRAPGSIGQCQTPGRVFKGKRMAGQLGNATRTTQNLEVVRVDAGRNLLLIKGSVPGARGGRVIITPAVKGRGRE
jgi:large subunit ribosomal protein L3